MAVPGSFTCGGGAGAVGRLFGSTVTVPLRTNSVPFTVVVVVAFGRETNAGALLPHVLHGMVAVAVLPETDIACGVVGGVSRNADGADHAADGIAHVGARRAASQETLRGA